VTDTWPDWLQTVVAAVVAALIVAALVESRKHG
jgi:hypothetical protein